MAHSGRGMVGPSIQTPRYGRREGGAWPVQVYDENGTKRRIGYAETKEEAAEARKKYYSQRR